MTFVRWALAVPLFALPNSRVAAFALEVAVTTVLAGMSTVAAVYLITERLLRPAFALALDRRRRPRRARWASARGCC